MPRASLTSLQMRTPTDIAAMAIVAQANLAQLQTAATKRSLLESSVITPPGAVTQHREAMIDWRLIKAYADDALLLRMREVWGQWCLFCWMFGCDDPLRPPAFATLTTDDAVRCPTHVGEKLIEIKKSLWRLRHEDRLRNEPQLSEDAGFQEEHRAALEMPMLVYGQNIRVCSNADLLACTCEYAGMLAAIRWIADDRWQWNQPGIMELDATPDGAS